MAYSQAQIIQIITFVAAQIATQTGVDQNQLVAIAIATARHESGLDPNAIGDNGNSVGLFQLNIKGEGAGMTVAQRQDPTANTKIAVQQIANVMKQNPGMSPGEIAAAAQRPANPNAYAIEINNSLGGAGAQQGMGGMAQQPSATDSLIQDALGWVGRGRYTYGGSGYPNAGVDCSGFTEYLFGQAGVQIGRDTGAQRGSSALTTVQGGLANALPGDLLFFGDVTGPHAHVGIYLGNGMMVSAENEQTGIAISNISGGAFGTEPLNLVRRAGGLGAATGSFDAGRGTYSVGVAQGGTGVPTTSTPAPPYDPNQKYPVAADERTWFLQNAPQDVWMLSNPELANILAYVKEYGIDPTDQSITGLISQTNWYKTHGADQRAWAQLYASDPAEAARQIGSQDANNPNFNKGAVLAVKTMAGQFGVNLTYDQINTLAINSKYYAWTPAEMQAAIAQYATIGKPSASLTQLQTQARDYLVPVSDPTLQQWLTNIDSGTATIDNYNAYLKQQAESLYPQMKSALDAGVTPNQYVDPYRQIAQQVLGVNASSINFMDPKWIAAINQNTPDGQRSTMTLDQWTTYIKSNPQYGYQSTIGAKNQAYDTANQLATLLGKVQH
jgi:cell wall-associated NlpC family hydrolase